MLKLKQKRFLEGILAAATAEGLHQLYKWFKRHEIKRSPEIVKNPLFDGLRKHRKRSQTIGIFLDKQPSESAYDFLDALWQPVISLQKSHDDVVRTTVVYPSTSFFKSISLVARKLLKGDSSTELTFGTRIDRMFAADLQVDIATYQSLAELGTVDESVAKEPQAQQIVLSIFNRRIYNHEYSHAKALLLGVHDTLTELELPPEPIKIDSLKKVDALQTLESETREFKAKIGSTEEFIPYVLDYLEVIARLEQSGFSVRQEEHKVSIAGGERFSVNLPVIYEKDKLNPLLVITKLDFAGMAGFVEKWSLNTEWLVRNKCTPIFDLDPEMLNDFDRLYRNNFRPMLSHTSPTVSPAANMNIQNFTEETDARKFTTVHKLSSNLSLITISQFAKSADFRICVAGGLQPQQCKIKLGNTVYHTTFENIGCFIFPDQKAENLAYAFYAGKTTRKKIESVLDQLKPGSIIELEPTASDNPNLTKLVKLAVDGRNYL